MIIEQTSSQISLSNGKNKIKINKIKMPSLLIPLKINAIDECLSNIYLPLSEHEEEKEKATTLVWNWTLGVSPCKRTGWEDRLKRYVFGEMEFLKIWKGFKV